VSIDQQETLIKYNLWIHELIVVFTIITIYFILIMFDINFILVKKIYGGTIPGKT